MNLIKINKNKSNNYHKHLFSISLAIIFCCSDSFAQEITATADDVKPSEVFHSSMAGEAGTNGGGPWVSEKESIWSRGEISAVEICHGNYVENLTFFYGGVRGTRFGPANIRVGCKLWKVPPAGGYLKSIYVWSGKYMDAVQFHMAEGSPSPRFGGGGGARTIIEDPNNGAIRMVDGKSGRYVDRLRVHFGLPYYINNIKPDYDALERQMDASEPKQIDIQVVNACRSRNLVAEEVSVKATVLESHSFTFSNTTSIGIETSIQGTFGGFIKVGSKFSVNTSFTVGSAKSFTSSSEHTSTIHAKAQPGEKVKVITIAKEANVELPFKYDLVHYRNGDKNDVVNSKTFNGVYKGIKTAETNSAAIDYSCDTDKPIFPEGSSSTAGDTTNNPSTDPRDPADTEMDDGLDEEIWGEEIDIEIDVEEQVIEEEIEISFE